MLFYNPFLTKGFTYEINHYHPVHNAEKYITATLDSVLQQDLGNPEELEVICVDDASTDASVALIKDYQQKDSRIRLFLNEKDPVCRSLSK